MSNINIRTDEQVKVDAERVFAELGLSMSSAINVFLRQVIRENGLPFDVTLNVPNKITAQAIEEGDRLAKDKSSKGFKDVNSLRKALGV